MGVGSSMELLEGQLSQAQWESCEVLLWAGAGKHGGKLSDLPVSHQSTLYAFCAFCALWQLLSGLDRKVWCAHQCHFQISE